jgi:hypothetical protein
MIPFAELDTIDVEAEGGSTPERILELYREMEPVTQVIFMAFVYAAFVHRTVSHEVGYERARALIERHRAGREVLISEIEAIGTP